MPPLLDRVADWLIPEQNPSGVVYGVLVIGALLAAESGSHESYGGTFASAAIAAVLYWLAHSYAGLLGERLEGGGRLTPAALARALAHDWSLIRGAALPLLALALAAATGAGEETAVTAALWTAVSSLVAFELIAALRSRARGVELAVELAVGLTMGTAIIALKVVLH